MGLGESIKLRREVLGMSLRDLAGRLGVSHTTVSKFEKNILVPNSPCLIRLSTILEIPVASLLRPDHKRIRLAGFAFRSREMTKKDEKQVNAETKEWLERYLQVEKLSGTHRSFHTPEGFPRTIRSYEDAETAANDLRVAWDLGTDPIDNLTNLLEDKGIKIGIIRGIMNFDALFTEYNNCPIIVMKDGLPRARQRFTLAHELGHCLLTGDGDLPEERIMHRFAGAFLVPAEKAVFELGKKRHKLSYRELFLLKEKYGLSMGAWLHRAMDLEIISQTLYRTVWKVFEEQGWNKREPGDDVPGQKPILMETLVLKAHAEGIISTSKAAELLNQNISTFCSFDGGPESGQTALLCS